MAPVTKHVLKNWRVAFNLHLETKAQRQDHIRSMDVTSLVFAESFFAATVQSSDSSAHQALRVPSPAITPVTLWTTLETLLVFKVKVVATEHSRSFDHLRMVNYIPRAVLWRRTTSMQSFEGELWSMPTIPWRRWIDDRTSDDDEDGTNNIIINNNSVKTPTSNNTLLHEKISCA